MGKGAGRWEQYYYDSPTGVPDISLLIVNQVQVYDGGAFCDDDVKQYPVPNDEHDIQKIGDREEVVRPLGVQYVR